MADSAKLRSWLWRIAVSIGVGVAVFVTAELASWIQQREAGVGSIAQRMTYSRLRSLEGFISRYADEHDGLPERLADLWKQDQDRGGIWHLQDEWRNDIVYEQSNGDFVVYALGRDGQLGGIGLDADLYPDRRNAQAARVPLEQFWSGTETGGNRSFCTLLGLTLAISFFATMTTFRSDFDPASRRVMLATAAAVVVGATIVAYFVTPFHIPSGH